MKSFTLLFLSTKIALHIIYEKVPILKRNREKFNLREFMKIQE